MFIYERLIRAAVSAAARGLIFVGLTFGVASLVCLHAQKATGPTRVPASEPGRIALPLPEDRGQAALEQELRRLKTTASVMMIVAHPDDEDGPLLTYLSRGMGVRTILFTMTRGEGGQNAMSSDTYDALGVMRTNELLKADEYYGVKQLWGTEADFGFSKTQEEAFARWGHERVLDDAVLAVRQERPQVIVATFVGAVSDGHGQHQVSGEIAQEVFKAAGDAKVFPEQLKNGLEPWQPLAVYGMVPFAPVTEKGMFDYATGKWAPAKFRNYVTGEWIDGAPATDVTLPVGTVDPVLGRSYVQIAREGWGHQKSQNGGANPTLSGPANASYHLWAAAPTAKGIGGAKGGDHDLFRNGKVNIDTGIAGLGRLGGDGAPQWLLSGLGQMDASVTEFEAGCVGRDPMVNAHKLTPIYRRALDLYGKVKASDLKADAKAGLELELGAKIEEFQAALAGMLGLDMVAFRTNESAVQPGGFRGNSADETPRSVSPGEEFKARIHISGISTEVELAKTWFESATKTDWDVSDPISAAVPAHVFDAIYKLKVPDDAAPTQPFFTRPSIEQPYYDIARPEWRDRSFAPYPVAAWAEFTFDKLPIRIGKVVQTLGRVTGPGGIYEPLVITPAIGVSVQPEAPILPLDGSALPVRVIVHTQAAAEGTVALKLPEGWKAEPAEAHFHRTAAGDTEPLLFSVTPTAVKAGAYTLQAVAHSGDRKYESGWQSVGYPGLLPYNIYQSAQLKTRKVDVKLAPGLRVGYVMGPGDLVPDAIEELGAEPHMLSAGELASGDLSAWNVIVIGIRAYSTRPELTAAQPRLDEFVRNGGTLIVQYQSGNFPAPLPLSMGRLQERVVDEQAPVKILNPTNSLMTSPNVITATDFNGWVEERGHSFLDTWDPGYTPLTETADAGQDPQRGGLVVAHPGKGTYIYVAYALYRQLPELVPGAYRILANLLSAGQGAASTGAHGQASAHR
jgi:LmbE family N-acetylglucosaminyl deacetylase